MNQKSLQYLVQIGRNDDFIDSFWNLLAFSSLSMFSVLTLIGVLVKYFILRDFDYGVAIFSLQNYIGRFLPKNDQILNWWIAELTEKGPIFPKQKITLSKNFTTKIQFNIIKRRIMTTFGIVKWFENVDLSIFFTSAFLHLIFLKLPPHLVTFKQKES